MRILITGATGLVGKSITKLLHKEGHTVHYLTTRREKIVTDEHYKGFYWNPSSGEIDTDSFKGVNAIINLAGATVAKRWTDKYKKEIVESRTQSIQTLKKGIEELDSNQIEAFVSASAIGIYPNSQDSLYSEKEEQVDASFLGSVVEKWEKEVDTLEPLGFPISKIRIGLVLSADGGALPKMTKPIRNYVGAIFGSGEQWQSWIHIHDLSRMFLFLLENRFKGVFNGVAPNPVTNTKLTREIASVLNRPLILPNIPQAAMNLTLGEMSYVLFASQRVSSAKVEKNGFEFFYPNVRGALNNLLGKENSENQEAKTSFLEEFIS